MPYLFHSLAYEVDSVSVFERIRHLPWPMLLDSGNPNSRYGRFDIVVADPFLRLETHNQTTNIISKNDDITPFEGNPFDILNKTLEKFRVELPDVEALADCPFLGGALGYWSYDLGRNLERLPELAIDAEQMPRMQVGLYDWAVITDHQRKTRYLISMCQSEATQDNWESLIATLERTPLNQVQNSFSVSGEISSNLPPMAYKIAFDKVKNYIYEGDCYQVNLAQRFSVRAQGDSFFAFKQIRKLSPAPYMAYLQYPNWQILSASPERFLQAQGNSVETKPIKGTRPRLKESSADAAMAEELKRSLKDRSENVMIVDLLRNDISKVCHVGSVKADRLFEVESFSNVHHLVSTVTGTLADNKSAVDLLNACFPGGSITGAPKLRSMEIIEELEPNRRGIYCGSIGYLSFHGKMDTNIAIRTAVFSGSELRFWAGGGIVADSECEKEYQETWDKASAWIMLSAQLRA